MPITRIEHQRKTRVRSSPDRSHWQTVVHLQPLCLFHLRLRNSSPLQWKRLQSIFSPFLCSLFVCPLFLFFIFLVEDKSLKAFFNVQAERRKYESAAEQRQLLHRPTKWRWKSISTVLTPKWERMATTVHCFKTLSLTNGDICGTTADCVRALVNRAP